jgi:CRP/FNR family transcriptional regulator, dissimilatory nitrate respiration regulator
MVKARDLARVPLFADLDRRHLEELAAIAEERRYARGESIFAEGDPAHGFHVVRTGRVKIYKLSLAGKQQILHLWSPGDPFGEVTVFQGGAYPAHAEAMEDCSSFFVPRDGLINLIKADPEFALALLAVLAARLRNLADLVETVALKEVPGRLAAHLLLLEERQGSHGRVVLEVTKSELAAHLGTIPETLSRVLARLVRENLIAPGGSRGYVVLDRPGLEDLALGSRKPGYPE